MSLAARGGRVIRFTGTGDRQRRQARMLASLRLEDDDELVRWLGFDPDLERYVRERDGPVTDRESKKRD